MLLQLIKVMYKHMNIVMIASFYVLYCIYASVSVKAVNLSNLYVHTYIHTIQLISNL